MLQCSEEFYVGGSYRTIKQFFYLTGFIPSAGETGVSPCFSGAVAPGAGD
jgi:hypothetical protein